MTSLRGDLIGSVICSLAGVILCALPHAIWYVRLGEPVWAADQDELYYLGVAAQAFREHPLWLGDPTRDIGHSLYQRLPLLPGIWIARLLGLGPQLISLVWRCWGGGLAGLAWYWVVRSHRVRSSIAIAGAIMLLTDAGMLEFKPFIRLGWVAWQVISGHTGALFASKPMIFRHFRVATPCLTMPYLLLFLGLHARARAVPSLHRQIASGLGFGLLFYVYFYYWTSAALALAMAVAIDRGHRRVSLNTAAIGALIGMPSLVLVFDTWSSNSADWLARSDKFLAIGRFSELNVPLPATLLLLAAAVVVRYRRELFLPWSLAASGIFLMNHQVLTGLQIENFHWSYIAGPCLSLLIGLMLADWIVRLRARFLRRSLLFVSVLCLVAGGWLRWAEAVRTKEVVEILGIYRDYRDQRLHDRAAPRLVPGAVVAGEELTVDWAAILEQSRPLANYWVMLSPSVNNDDWDLRIALNSYLFGQARSAFLLEQVAALSRPGFQGPWRRDRRELARRLDSRMSFYDRITAQPERYFDQTHLRYSFLARNHEPPGERSLWTKRQDGPFRSIWEYRPSP
jgi:hypothetical protein